MRNRTITIILFILLIGDVGYSFLQHYHMPLDGDISEVVGLR